LKNPWLDHEQLQKRITAEYEGKKAHTISWMLVAYRYKLAQFISSSRPNLLRLLLSGYERVIAE